MSERMPPGVDALAEPVTPVGTRFVGTYSLAFLGVWMGGYLYDHFGTYDQVWWLGVALGVFAAVVHWPWKGATALPLPRMSVRFRVRPGRRDRRRNDRKGGGRPAVA